MIRLLFAFVLLFFSGSSYATFLICTSGPVNAYDYEDLGYCSWGSVSESCAVTYERCNKYKTDTGPVSECPTGTTPDHNRVCQLDQPSAQCQPPSTGTPPNCTVPEGSEGDVPNCPAPQWWDPNQGCVDPQCTTEVCVITECNNPANKWCPPIEACIALSDPCWPGAQPADDTPPGDACADKTHSFPTGSGYCQCEIGYVDTGDACVQSMPQPGGSSPPQIGGGGEGSGGGGTGGTSGEGGSGGSTPNPSGGGPGGSIPGSEPIGGDPDGDPGTDDVPSGGGSSGWGTVPTFSAPKASFADDPKIQDSVKRISDAWNGYEPVAVVSQVMDLSFTPSTQCPQLRIDTGSDWFGLLETDSHCQVIEPHRELIQNIALVLWAVGAVMLFLMA